MTKYFYNTETGQVDGTPVTTALLPANGVSPTLTVSGGPTVTFRTAAAAERSLGIRSQHGSASMITQLRFGSIFSSTDMHWDGAFDCNGSYPSGGMRIFGFYNNAFATLVCALHITPAGKLELYNAASGLLWTSTATVPLSGMWRFNIRATQGATNTTGVLTFSYYASYAATSPTETMTPALTNVNLLTTAAPITSAIKGKITSPPTWTAPQFDADQFTDNPSVDGLFTGPNFYLLPVTGTVAGSSSSSGAVTALLPVAGTAAAVSAASGAVAARGVVAGAAAAVTGSSGDVTALRPVSGTAAAASSSSGAVSVLSSTAFAVAGTAAALSGASGAVAVRAAVSGLAAAVSGASGSVGSCGAVSGAAAAASSSSGDVASLLSVSGVAVATSGSSGAVLTLGPRIDITVTGRLAPRAWGAALPPRRITGALPARRWKGTLR